MKLYRIFAQDDELLYVGITNDFDRRMAEHAAEKPWWGAVAYFTVHPHPDRDCAEEAEEAAIRAENPKHNITYSRIPRRPREHRCHDWEWRFAQDDGWNQVSAGLHLLAGRPGIHFRRSEG